MRKFSNIPKKPLSQLSLPKHDINLLSVVESGSD
jgi:hypothetical protein